MANKTKARKNRNRPAASLPTITLRRNGTTKSWLDDSFTAQIGTGMKARMESGKSPAEALGALLLSRPRLIAATLVKNL